MYKNVSESWQKIRGIAGRFGTPSRGKGSSFVREGRRAAREFIKLEKEKKGVPCPVCSNSIPKSELNNHLFTEHELSECRFCRTLIAPQALRVHILNKHGESALTKWINGRKNHTSTPSRSEDKKKGVTSPERKDLGPVKCSNCMQVVDGAFISIHRERFCKRSAKL